MTEKPLGAIEGKRIYWLDNLRAFAIFLVVLLHAGLVYESSGIPAFFWIVDDPATNNLSGILNLMIDIVAMPAIFFVSGFFAPASLKRKPGLAFLRAKFRRLMIPWLVAVFTLIPLYKVIFLYSRNLPQEDWATYFHWSNGIWNQNWLWFLPVLFLFNVLYLLYSRVDIKVRNITLAGAIWAVALIAFLYSVCMDLFNLQGWTKTILLDFQNERILIYLLVFFLGTFCWELKTFESEPKRRRLYVSVACTVWIPVNLYLFLVIHSLINPDRFLLSEIGDVLLIQGSYLLSTLCLLYVVINTFRFYLNRKGKLWRSLSRNSYGVYIIHVVVMGGMALTMLDAAIPSVLKHLILAVSTYLASNLMISSYRRVRVALVESRGTSGRPWAPGKCENWASK